MSSPAMITPPISYAIRRSLVEEEAWSQACQTSLADARYAGQIVDGDEGPRRHDARRNLTAHAFERAQLSDGSVVEVHGHAPRCQALRRHAIASPRALSHRVVGLVEAGDTPLSLDG